MRGVAYKSYNLAREAFNMKEDVARSLFLMGLMHDFAYAFVENQTEHEHEGGRILKLSGFNWAGAVFDHGDPDVDDWTDELLILNLADMTTSPDSKPIAIDKRLEDIENRYDTDSIQATKSAQIDQTNQRRTRQTRPNNSKLIDPKVIQIKIPGFTPRIFYEVEIIYFAFR